MRENALIQTDYLDFSRKSSTELFDEYQLHCHSFFELYYFISGNVRYMVEGKNYVPTPGSLLLLKPGAVHGVQNTSEELYCRYAFHFMPSLIPAEYRELLFSPFYGERIYFEQVSLEPLFDHVLESAGLPGRLQSIALSCRFESLLTALYPLTETGGADPTDSLAFRITAHINDHISEELSLEEIAHAFFISKSQLNRVFKKNLDMTVGSYIALKRSAMARQLLLQGETAAVAASACGFKDYSTFFRTYKRYLGSAPTQSITPGRLEGIPK